jgi:hypothetical protein
VSTQPLTATAGFQPTFTPVRFISWVLPPANGTSSTTATSLGITNVPNANGITTFSTGIAETSSTVPGVPPSGMIIADSVLEERYDDESIITENPVETGSVSNDHAYDLPQELEVTYVWAAASPQAAGQPSFLNVIYALVLALKVGKVLLTVSTGRRLYQKMLLKSISTISDKDTENILQLRLSLRQLILVSTQVITSGQATQAPNSAQLIGAKTMSTSNLGTNTLANGPQFNSGTPTGS